MHVLKEMTRVVKPGGKVICLETSQPTMIGFRQGYILYFKYIMPLFGKLFAKVIRIFMATKSASTFPVMKNWLICSKKLDLNVCKVEAIYFWGSSDAFRHETRIKIEKRSFRLR